MSNKRGKYKRLRNNITTQETDDGSIVVSGITVQLYKKERYVSRGKRRKQILIDDYCDMDKEEIQNV